MCAALLSVRRVECGTPYWSVLSLVKIRPLKRWYLTSTRLSTAYYGTLLPLSQSQARVYSRQTYIAFVEERIMEVRNVIELFEAVQN